MKWDWKVKYMNPEISVIVPVYNVEKYVEKCINSILGQTYKNFELIIVNDGSTDNSLKKIKKFSDDRIILIDQKNQGLSGARNTGISKAKGKYVTFIDSDDWISKGYLQEMMYCAHKYNADIVSIKECTVTEDNKYGYIQRPLLVFKNKVADALFGLYNSNFACAKLLKKTLFIDNNIYFPLRKNYEDLGTMYKIYDHAKRVVIADTENYFYLLRTGSITQSKDKRDIESQIEFIREIENYKLSQNYDFFGLYILVKIFSAISDLSKSEKVSSKDRKKMVRELYALSKPYHIKFKYFRSAHNSDQLRAVLVKLGIANTVLRFKNIIKDIA